MSLDEKKWCKRALESKLIYIYDIKGPNGMNCIHDNEVNKISDWNLLHDILKSYKHTKSINRNYSPTLHECLNTQKGISKFKNFWYYWIVDVVPQLWWEG